MSHITDIKLRVKDLDALKDAAAECQLEFMQGQKTFKWFGQFVGGTTPPPGRNPAEYGKCEHALRLKGAQSGDYEIGVVKALDGNGFDLMVDTWQQRRLLNVVGGPSMNKLRQEYAAAVTMRKAQAKLAPKGFVVRRQVLAGGRICVSAVKR